MTVSVYARHSSKCSKSRERGTGQFKRCKCPLWLRWGKDGKKSAKTRSWDIATKAARKLEQELELAANGIEPLKKPDHITIQSAVDLYLSDMNQRSLAKPTVDKARRMITRLRDFANTRGIYCFQRMQSLIGFTCTGVLRRVNVLCRRGTKPRDLDFYGFITRFCKMVSSGRFGIEAPRRESL